MKRFSAAGLVLLTGVLAGSATSAQGTNQQAAAPAQAPAAPAGNADTGKKLYNSHGCYQCHGLEGQGGAAGPRLAARGLPWAGFSAYVRKPVNQMPLYTPRILSDADLAHIYAFVQSRPTPPPAKSIPLLQ
jgi:mono/diheme cytochrome c family protein